MDVSDTDMMSMTTEIVVTLINKNGPGGSTGIRELIAEVYASLAALGAPIEPPAPPVVELVPAVPIALSSMSAAA